MQNESLTLTAVVDKKIFRKFALFDGLYVKSIWKLPLLFALILCASAAACFSLRWRNEDAVMIGSILLLIGLGLPLVHFYSFIRSIAVQIKKIGLDSPRAVYSLNLSRGANGIEVEVPKAKKQSYDWEPVYCAYRVRGCIYLYVEKNKAFLLPVEQEEGEVIWTFLIEMLPKKKLRAWC